MANGKKSFISYCDWGEVFDSLTDSEAGKLVKHLYGYVRDQDPKSDKLTEALFIQMKQTLKRDLRKYEAYVEKQAINGAKGGRPKKAKEPKPLLDNPTKAKKADSVNAIVSDSVNDIIKVQRFTKLNNEKFISEYLKWLDHRTKSKFKKLTNRGIELQLKLLNEQIDPIEIMNNSIMNGWQGLFQLKNNGKQPEKIMTQKEKKFNVIG